MSKKKSSLTKIYRRWRTRRGTRSHSSCSEPLPFSPPLRGFPSCRMVLEPRVLLDASLVDTTDLEASPEQATDLRFDVPGTRVSDPRVSDPQDPSTQRMVTPDLPTIRNWLDTANTHNARLAIVVKLWDAQPEDRISLAETYTGSSVLRDTWDDARGELRLELKAGAALPTQDVAEAFLDALKAVQLEASGAEDASTREVWVFPTLAGASEVAYRVERSSGMVRHYVLDASLGSYADARKTAEQQHFFGVDGYLGHFPSDAEKTMYRAMAQRRSLWLGLSDRENAGVWKVSSGPKEGQVFWRETDAGVGIYGSGARSSGLPGSGLPESGWGDADREKLWGTNDFPQPEPAGDLAFEDPPERLRLDRAGKPERRHVLAHPGARLAVGRVVLGVVPVLFEIAHALRRRGDLAD